MPVCVVFHKQYPLLTDDPAYIPMHAGKALSEKKLGITGDDTGDNISDKNISYAELTGLYWIWKNTDSEYAGLCHYRRYFMYKKPSFRMRLGRIMRQLIGRGKNYSWFYYSSRVSDGRFILTGNEIEELMSDYDAIVPVPLNLNHLNVWDDYDRRHFAKDFQIARDIVAEKYPDYTRAFDEVVKKKTYHSYNMFIMRRPYFDAYAQWLFDVLLEMEARIDISEYDDYQKRIYGFISERLFNVWLTKNRINTVQLPVLYTKYIKT